MSEAGTCSWASAICRPRCCTPRTISRACSSPATWKKTLEISIGFHGKKLPGLGVDEVDESKLLSWFFFLETSQQSWQLKTSGAIEKACLSLHLHTDQSQLVTKFISNSLSNSQHQKGGVESQIVAFPEGFENLLESGFNSSTVSSTSWVAASRASADDNPLGTSPKMLPTRRWLWILVVLLPNFCFYADLKANYQPVSLSLPNINELGGQQVGLPRGGAKSRVRKHRTPHLSPQSSTLGHFAANKRYLTETSFNHVWKKSADLRKATQMCIFTNIFQYQHVSKITSGSPKSFPTATSTCRCRFFNHILQRFRSTPGNLNFSQKAKRC